MNRSSYVIFALAALVFAAGIVHLANQELAGGSVYPEYSSLRADPDGCKLLFDALARLPGLSVERNLLPLSGLQVKHAVVFFIGADPRAFDTEGSDLTRLETLARTGNRVVVTFRYERSLSRLEMPRIEKAWDVRVATDKSGPRFHPFFFLASKGWEPVRQAGAKILAMERAFSDGSIMLTAESGGWANDSVLFGRDPALISRAVGDYGRVVFDESHLGIAESGAVVGLARRFHLMGFAAGLAVCALLFLWKKTLGYPPPAPAPAAARAGITAQAALATLLRRHIPAKELAATCWRAWLETGRNLATAERIGRAEQILREPSAGPADTLRRIGAVLQSKGEL